jgi:hypothetical protein
MIAEQAARLRAIQSIRTPDVIQISATLNAGATHFLPMTFDCPTCHQQRFFSLCLDHQLLDILSHDRLSRIFSGSIFQNKPKNNKINKIYLTYFNYFGK